MRRLFNIASHIPEELKAFEAYFERIGENLVIYVPRVTYKGNNAELIGKTERLLPDFLEPYYLYPVEDIQSALDPDVKIPLTTADDRTISRWRRKWRVIGGELRCKAEEKKRIGIRIHMIPEEMEAATREIKARLKDRWYSKCYVMAFLTIPSKWTNLKHPPSFSWRTLLCEVPSFHGGKADVERERET